MEDNGQMDGQPNKKINTLILKTFCVVVAEHHSQ